MRSLRSRTCASLRRPAGVQPALEALVERSPRCRASPRPPARRPAATAGGGRQSRRTRSRRRSTGGPGGADERRQARRGDAGHGDRGATASSRSRSPTTAAASRRGRPAPARPHRHARARAPGGGPVRHRDEPRAGDDRPCLAARSVGRRGPDAERPRRQRLSVSRAFGDEAQVAGRDGARGSLSQARSPARPSGRDPRRRAAWRRDGTTGRPRRGVITRMAILGRASSSSCRAETLRPSRAATSSDERDVRTPRPDRLQRLAEPARRGNDRDPRFLGDRVAAPADRGVRIGHEHAGSTGAPPGSVGGISSRAPFSLRSGRGRARSARARRAWSGASFCWMCARWDSTVRTER